MHIAVASSIQQAKTPTQKSALQTENQVTKLLAMKGLKSINTIADPEPLAFLENHPSSFLKGKFEILQRGSNIRLHILLRVILNLLLVLEVAAATNALQQIVQHLQSI